MSRFRSIWQTSVNATKKAFTWNVDDWIPPAEKYIFNFNTKDELKRWHLYSDSEYGGLFRVSSASLEITDNKEGSKGIFSGNLSLGFTEDSKWNIRRGGFCEMRSKKFDGFIDLDGYDTIAMKLRGDGRCYISTVFDTKTPTEVGKMDLSRINLHRELGKFSRTTGRQLMAGYSWYITEIPLARYLPTWRGNVIDAWLEMNPPRIVGMSLSVNAEGGVPGTWRF